MINFHTISDKDLYEMCSRGDGDAWKYLYNFILTICRKMNLEDAEDMTSKITLDLLEKGLKKVKQKQKFRAFVKVMSKNRIIDSFKSFSKKMIPMSSFHSGDDEEEESAAEIGCSDPDQIDRVFRVQVFTIVNNAIELLSPECRRVIREYIKKEMGFYDGYKELSRVLKMKEGTISSRVTRCLRTLIAFPEIRALKIFV